MFQFIDWRPPIVYADENVKKVSYCIFVLFLFQCGPCRTFTPQLVETYKKVKGAGEKFEIIFCSSDREEDAYKEYFATMPWLALPFGDSRKKSLSRVFDVTGELFTLYSQVYCTLLCWPQSWVWKL